METGWAYFLHQLQSRHNSGGGGDTVFDNVAPQGDLKLTVTFDRINGHLDFIINDNLFMKVDH